MAESSLERSRVIIMLNTMRAANPAAAPKEAPAPAAPPRKNMVITAIRAGKRPLQGVTLLVRIATSRSRGLSMMRQPLTPTALQP